MSVKTNTSQAIKHHLSGIEKIKNGALDWIACGECLIKIKTELTHGEYIPYIKSNEPDPYIKFWIGTYTDEDSQNKKIKVKIIGPTFFNLFFNFLIV